jgi:hypothetical protein
LGANGSKAGERTLDITHVREELMTLGITVPDESNGGAMSGLASGEAGSPRTRGTADSVMQECLRLQLGAEPRGRVAQLFGRSPLHPDARSWYRGAVGELRVAGALSRLDPAFTVLHAVPTASGDHERPGDHGDPNLGLDHSATDHVVIGPPGIFSLNAKSHAGRRIRVAGNRLLVNGRKSDQLDHCLYETGRASTLFSSIAGTPVEVTPVVVVVDPTSVTRKSPQVDILEVEQVPQWFATLPRQLSDDTIAHFSTIAERSGTWRSRAEADDDTMRHTQRFERLQREVNGARRRARVWMLGGVAATVIIAAAVLAGIVSQSG